MSTGRGHEKEETYGQRGRGEPVSQGSTRSLLSTRKAPAILGVVERFGAGGGSWWSARTGVRPVPARPPFTVCMLPHESPPAAWRPRLNHSRSCPAVPGELVVPRTNRRPDLRAAIKNAHAIHTGLRSELPWKD